MDKITLNRERRRLSTLERLGSNHPRCSCGEGDWRCLQLVPTHGSRGDGGAVTGCLNPRVDGAACVGEDKGAVEAPGLFNGIAVHELSVASSV